LPHSRLIPISFWTGAETPRRGRRAREGQFLLTARPSSSIQGNTLTLLSLGLCAAYVWLALSVAMHRSDQYVVERTALAAAVTNVVYRQPLGMIDAGVLGAFSDQAKPTQAIVDQVAKGSSAARSYDIAKDGYGYGYVVIASIAMRMFGTDVFAPGFLMFGLMAISSVLLVRRFPDVGAMAVPLYFSCLSLMLFTALVYERVNADQIPVGGIRYYSLLGILPAIHLALEIADSSVLTRAGYVALGVQAGIMSLAVVVRDSARILVVSLACIALCVAFTHFRNRSRLRRSLWKTCFMTLIGAGVVAMILLAIPRAYVADGRAGSVVWHRIFAGFGADPAWPYPGIRDKYLCPDITDGIGGGILDANSYCVWVSYAQQHGLTAQEIYNNRYGRLYERVLRASVFDVVSEYPRQVLMTIAYYKPRLIYNYLPYKVRLDGQSAEVKFVLFLSVLITLVCMQIQLLASWRNLALLAGIASAFAVAQIMPFLLAWAFPHTVGDLVFFLYFFVGLATAAFIGALVMFIQRAAILVGNNRG
jgi:hypothetical protein